MNLTKELSVGVEPEGHIDISAIVDGEYHTDGSVDVDGVNNGGECDGSCRDDCTCRDECECESCQRCDVCNHMCEDCTCDQCWTCMKCDNNYEECICEQAHYGGQCQKCTEVAETQPACDECQEAFIDENWVHNCADCGNRYIECDLDCGCDCYCECDCEQDSDGEGSDGEAVSYPMDESDMEGWLNKNEPAILRTNGTCGMHIHVGRLTMQEYGVLMDRKFHDYLKAELYAWGCTQGLKEGSSFWRRIEGNNTFCKDEFRPEAQKYDRSKSGQRYCFVNYCWELHKTVEIRILPCFQKPELRVKGFKVVMSIIHKYLANNKPKIHSLEIKEVV